MEASYFTTGRTNQKRRTRSALIDAAIQIVREGRTPSVAEVAEAAHVSRATAYRYFQTQESLLVEAATAGAMPLPDDLLGPPGHLEGAEERVDVVVSYLTSFMLEHDPGLRVMLRATLDRPPGGDVPVRAGRRTAYLEAALLPLRSRLEEEEFCRLNAAIGMVVGTEALVVLRDIYFLEPDEALAVMRWAAAALLAAATGGGWPPADAGRPSAQPSKNAKSAAA